MVLEREAEALQRSRKWHLGVLLCAGRRLKNKLTCGVHASVTGGRQKQRGYFGTYENTIAYSHLCVGLTSLNT